jgi:hypothetical protein
MNIISVNLVSNKICGFGNQIYSLAHSLSYAIENNINIVIYKPFLNQIETDSYSNISDIIDIKATNLFLLKYKIQIADYNDFDFKILNITYGYDIYTIDIPINLFISNNIFHIPKNFSFSEFSNILINKYDTAFNNHLCKLKISYKLYDSIITKYYEIDNNFPLYDIIININNIIDYTFSVFCNTLEFYDIRTNIVFNKKFINYASSFFEKVSNYQKINCIHLRLENDAICHWSKYKNIEESLFKLYFENIYINNIIENIKKDELTIVLSSDYNNNVIKFLKDNNYNFLITEKVSPYRDLSAIYDYHIAQYCNNIYIGLFESSFSYLILYRIKEKIHKYCEIKILN